MSCELEATIQRLDAQWRAETSAEIGPERFAEMLPRLEEIEALNLAMKAEHDAAPCVRLDCMAFHCPRSIVVLCTACVDATGRRYVHLPPACPTAAPRLPAEPGLAFVRAAEALEAARLAVGAP